MRTLSRAVLAALMFLPLAAALADTVPPAKFADAQRRAKLMAALPRIEAMVAQGFKDLNVPGLSYAVVIDGEVVLARGLGVADVASQTPVTEDTAFRIASMTKSFTALAVLKLRDAGKLSLDDPVARHVPELLGWAPATSDAGPITLRHLLAHSGGLPEDNPMGDRQLALTPAQFSAWLAGGVPLARAPGSGFEYSNLGYMLLGRVVGNVSGRPYQHYIRDEILLPLGMAHTYWSAAAVPAGQFAQGHRPKDKGFEAEPLLEDGEGGAMGGLITTPRDLARFVAAMLAAWPPRDTPEGPPALRRTLREMQLGQGLPDLWLGRRLPGGPMAAVAYSYGYGLQASTYCKWGRQVTHGGGLPGFGSLMTWLPDHGVGVISMANLTYASGGRLITDAVHLLHDTGALQAREPVAAAALQQAARLATELVLDWTDARAQALAADNLFLDQPLPERREAIALAREGLGRCTPGALTPENPLRGKQRLGCEQGWLDIELTLAPVPAPRVQSLAVTSGRPLQPALQQTVDDIAAAVARGARTLDLAASADRSSIAAVLESTRSAYGSCKAGAVLEGNGTSQAKLKLVCDRGTLEMSVTLEQGRLTKVSLRPELGTACMP
jgi:CubicO group peptidase (beta-lactamase class C family)